jgi:uncharacterized protein YkwD
MLLALCATAPLAAAERAPLIAPESRCPGQADPAASAAAQARTMRCLVNVARQGRGLAALAGSASLDRAARNKSADMLRCDEFSHQACGREFTYWMQRFGFPRNCAGAENIAWGSGSLGSARAIFSAWMKSPGHRENILGPYAQIGIGLRVGTLEGTRGAHVWTQEFGAECTRRAMH